MPSLDSAVIVVAGIVFVAAFVNGALGYGFSSLTVPVALVFYTNRILNPAVVVIEVVINIYVLLMNLSGVSAVWRRALPILIGLLPGIGLGALVLTSVQPGWVKFSTYTIILPLILLQAAGWRRPIQSTWLSGVPFGTALGVLYSVTTISGPPLAILFNNQGLVKSEFRAGLALVRVVESSVTAIVYYQLWPFHRRKRERIVDVCSQRRGWNTARHLSDPPAGCRYLPSNMYELRCMGRGFRSLPGFDRPEVVRKSLGL